MIEVNGKAGYNGVEKSRLNIQGKLNSFPARGRRRFDVMLGQVFVV